MAREEAALERIVAAAREDGTRYFNPDPLTSIQLAASLCFAEHAYVSWFVRVDTRGSRLVVTVWEGPQGELAVTHYAPAAVKEPSQDPIRSVA